MRKAVRNINEIRTIVRNMPKTLNEAIYEDYSDLEQQEEPEDMRRRGNVAPQYDNEEDMPSEEMGGAQNIGGEGPMGDMGENNSVVGDDKIQNFITNMRKESLEIMKALADNPDDSTYVFAKRIFQLADKAHEDQKEGKDINGQPKQQMNQQAQQPQR